MTRWRMCGLRGHTRPRKGRCKDCGRYMQRLRNLRWRAATALTRYWQQQGMVA